MIFCHSILILAMFVPSITSTTAFQLSWGQRTLPKVNLLNGKTRYTANIQRQQRASNSAVSISQRKFAIQNDDQQLIKTEASLYRSEGLFSVIKPMHWTSSDVVVFIRNMLERDARERGANPVKPGRRNKSRIVKVGHGGTLDPLATGVLVIGVGKGTKELQR